jgi:hypothetical protein
MRGTVVGIETVRERAQKADHRIDIVRVEG